jgi:F0F1-type ATP synthase membrane subunit c/vacuolar-type H+-ATPase subunit K
MGIGIGTIVFADGAILAWALDTSTAGPNAQTIGYVLLGLGSVVVLLSLVFWSSWAGRGYFARGERLYRRW